MDDFLHETPAEQRVVTQAFSQSAVSVRELVQRCQITPVFFTAECRSGFVADDVEISQLGRGTEEIEEC